MPDFLLTFGTAKPTDVKIVGLVPPNVMTCVRVYGGVLHFNGMFGILYFDGMPRFILTFGTAKPTILNPCRFGPTKRFGHTLGEWGWYLYRIVWR
jgi:hypothetical protein